jgi:DedD protein
MENRLKERMTGAAILVALIVMLVPEMFRGQGGEVASTSSGSGEGPPVRSYTIDLSNSPSHNGPLQSTAANQTPIAPATAASPPAAAAPAPTPQPAAVSAEPASVPSQSTARVVRAATPSVSLSPGKTAGASGWRVQIGIFAKRENAERLMREAQGRGFNVSVSSADSKGLFHVHAAGLPDRAAAQTLSQKLKSNGFQAAVVAP